MLRRQVNSIMLSLSEYAVVDRDATLAQAIRVLEQSKAGLSKDRQPHRAVLVQDQHGKIIGKMGHLAFLRALLPENRQWDNSDMLERAGVSDDMRETSAGMFELLSEDTWDFCQQARSIRVGDVCTPATANIEYHASLLDATRAFIEHQTLSLLVNQHGKTVGILRLADLFDEMSRQIMQECSPAS